MRRMIAGRRPYVVFTRTASVPHRALMPQATKQERHGARGLAVLDLLIAVLGTAGILLMAAYALLCDRI